MKKQITLMILSFFAIAIHAQDNEALERRAQMEELKN